MGEAAGLNAYPGLDTKGFTHLVIHQVRHTSLRHTALSSPLTVYRENGAEGDPKTHPGAKPGFECKQLAPETILFPATLQWLPASEKALPSVTPTGPSEEKSIVFLSSRDALICSIIKGGNDCIPLSRPQRTSRGARRGIGLFLRRQLSAPWGLWWEWLTPRAGAVSRRARGLCHMTPMSGQIRTHHSDSSLLRL